MNNEMIDDLIEYLNDEQRAKDTHNSFILLPKEREEVIDALTFYKEMNIL